MARLAAGRVARHTGLEPRVFSDADWDPIRDICPHPHWMKFRLFQLLPDAERG